MQARKYKLSDSLANIIETSNQKFRDYAANVMDHYIEQYKKNLKIHNAESIAIGFIDLIDNLIKESPLPEGEKITCKKGCGNCCLLNVDISKEEAILILEGCKEIGISIDWDKLKIQQTYDHNTYFSLDKEKRKCIFLSKKNTCKIYKFRPIACRKLYSLDKPHKCDIDNGKLKVKRFVSLQAEIVACSVMTATEFSNMPSLLLKYKSKVYG